MDPPNSTSETISPILGGSKKLLAIEAAITAPRSANNFLFTFSIVIVGCCCGSDMALSCSSHLRL